MQNIVTLGEINDALKFTTVTAAQLAEMGFAALANKPICEALPQEEARRLRTAKLYPAESIGQIRVTLAKRLAAPASCLHQFQEPAPATALDALREAEAALEVAIARILKSDPGHSISVTSEAKALVAVRAALSATPAADIGNPKTGTAAPVAMPEPDGFLESHPFGPIYHRGKPSQIQMICGACPPMYEAGTVRALLATATGLPAQAAEQAPVLYVSKEQLDNHRDHADSEAGRYLPCRITPAGKFTAPLFAAPQAQADARDAQKCADCGCPETSWCCCPDSPMNTKPGTKERIAAIAAAKGE